MRARPPAIPVRAGRCAAARHGQPGEPAAIPGHNPGLAIDSFSVGQVADSPDGQRWVVSGVARNGVGGTRPFVVLAGDAGGIRLALVQNVPMPGSGVSFAANPTSLAINDAGDFAFSSNITGGTALAWCCWPKTPAAR